MTRPKVEYEAEIAKEVAAYVLEYAIKGSTSIPIIDGLFKWFECQGWKIGRENDKHKQGLSNADSSPQNQQNP